MSTTFILQAKHILLNAGDHTSVHSVDNDKFFRCWGGKKCNKEIAKSPGNYKLADSYRHTLSKYHDTAGIGIYAIDGVCQQSANCFLLVTDPKFSGDPNSLRIKCNKEVRGYWFTSMLYGDYGRNFEKWLENVFNPVLVRHNLEPQPINYYLNNPPENGLLNTYLLSNSMEHFNNVLNSKMRVFNNSDKIRELISSLLDDKDSIVAGSDFMKNVAIQSKGAGFDVNELIDLCKQLNQRCVSFQRDLYETLHDASLYEELTGVEQKDGFNPFQVIDTEILIDPSVHDVKV